MQAACKRRLLSSCILCFSREGGGEEQGVEHTLMIQVVSNRANFAKHQANPKVGPIIAKMMAKFNQAQ
ncbi:hypothetical protein BRADI_3g00245v3 [Brachypodium distachyon]|uniref:Uncharacterized protein n=1 Tax=Brachypodium distachyon TaxID=15368 RepID=A0A0Q3HWP7_BRADI|nr:hypothetical protein BRADI_3g00245v3 [Brachypodium distachyon]